MICRKCGAAIPFASLKCNNCHSDIWNKMGNELIPPTDMYGNKVIAFTPDEAKDRARWRYYNQVLLNESNANTPEFQIHCRKACYYVNKNVIGYSLLKKTVESKWGDKITNYYTYHEIDRRNIRGVGYDSKYGEYIILLYQPVYVDYDLPPTTEFRFQDIFDDTKLTIALKCSLPAKNMPF